MSKRRGEKDAPWGGGGVLCGIMHLPLAQKVLKQWLLLPVAESISQSTFLGVVQQPWKFGKSRHPCIILGCPSKAELALAICLLQQPLTFAFDLLFRSLGAASARKENRFQQARWNRWDSSILGQHWLVIDKR